MKLPEAAKLFGKKFASGASITKNPMEKDQIEVSSLFVVATRVHAAFRGWKARLLFCNMAASAPDQDAAACRGPYMVYLAECSKQAC